MLSEYEVLHHPNYILLIFGVIRVQRFKELRLNQTLLEQPLLVFEDLQRHELFSFMVEGSKNGTKGALANFLNELIPISDVLVHHNYIFLLFVIEPMIINVRSIFKNTHF